MSRSVRTVFVFVVFVLCAAGVAVGVATLPNPPAAHATGITAPAPATPLAAPAAAAPVTDPGTGYVLTGADQAFLARLLGPATDVDPAQAAGLVFAAQRVCEGHTAGVPVPVMAASVAAELGAGPAEAATFVAVADAGYCGSVV